MDTPIDFTSIHGAAASLLGALAGLSFAGALQPVTFWFDRAREYEDQVASLSDWCRTFSKRLGVEDPPAVAAAGESLLEQTKAARWGVLSAENRLAILLLSHLEVLAKNTKDPDFVSRMRKLPAVATLDYSRVRTVAESDCLVPDEDLDLFDETVLLRLLAHIRAATRAFALIAVLRRITMTALGLSILFAAYGFMVLRDSALHDNALPQITTLIEQVCCAAEGVILFGSYLAVAALLGYFISWLFERQPVTTEFDWVAKTCRPKLTSKFAATPLASIDISLFFLLLWVVGVLAYFF